ncbi:cutinase transcription factor 1 alpha [Fusarium beomiforme]|uniref:Cutinase transcription factor 1 alpha n=1 Tax=Fusarium beomiforme TaxID=44412 RepID=A0A9P5E637_9HYPO|nr:cutinase transcription factor 1 alpha [Fusarium beomiforme]
MAELTSRQNSARLSSATPSRTRVARVASVLALSYTGCYLFVAYGVVVNQDDMLNDSIAVITPQSNENVPYQEQNLTAEATARSNESDSQQQSLSGNDRSYFLGDSSSLSYIVEMICSPRSGVSEPVKVHYPIPASIADRAVVPTRPQVEPLGIQDALTMPSKEISDRLVYTFFEIIHPPYPVIDRRAFSEAYKQGKASPTLLHAMYLATFILCDESLIEAAGFSDRTAARKHHYLRMKTLYDVDHETDRNALTAAVFLLGFWWNGPDDQKDSWFWLGCATSCAQSLGMYRSAVSSRLSPEKRALRKRIWWSIYTRDRHTAACLGKPCRIRDEDCDIEPLTEEDFYFDDDHNDPLITRQTGYHTAFAMEMTKAAEILGDIVIAEYSPRRPALERYKTENLKQRLEQWEAQLPKCMQRAPLDETLGPAFWASQLHMAYQNYYILLFRPKAIEDLTPSEAEGDIWARRAADSITRMAEDLLAVGAMSKSQMHIVPAVFGALSIHTLVICRRDPIRRQLAGNKSRQCILALSELAKHWPVGLWIMRFFGNLMRRLTGQGSAVSAGSIVDVTSRIANSNRGEDSTLNTSAEVSRATSQTLAENGGGFNEVANAQVAGAVMETNDLFQQPAADQFCFDTFWADDAIDVDLLLQHGLCPLLPGNFGTFPPGIDSQGF